MIPLIDLKLDKSLEKRIAKAILKVLSSRNYILGSEVEGFEKEFADFLGVKYAVGVASGTDALRLAMRALGIGNGDRVLTVSFTSPFTAIAIIEEGAVPVFCDIDPDTLTIDPKDIEKKIDKKTKAIMPVHLYGNPADMAAILRLAKIHDLKVIEDACQAHGSIFNDKTIGSFGDAAAFSFYPTKNLGGLGDGGIVITNNKKIANKLRLLRHGGQTKRFWHKFNGVNSRLDEIQAAVLRTRLSFLGKENKRREKLAKNYRLKLAKLPIKFQKSYEGATSANHLFVVRTKKRRLLKNFLLREGIFTDIYYPFPVHTQPAFSEFSEGKLKITNQVSKEILAIPVSPALSDGEQSLIIKKIKEFYSGKNEF